MSNYEYFCCPYECLWVKVQGDEIIETIYLDYSGVLPSRLEADINSVYYWDTTTLDIPISEEEYSTIRAFVL